MKKVSVSLKDNYIVVQSWMAKELKLKGNALIIYALIYGFSQTEKQACTCGDEYIAAWINASTRAVINIKNELVGRGLVEKIDTKEDGRMSGYRALAAKIHEESSPIKTLQKQKVHEESSHNYSKIHEESSPNTQEKYMNFPTKLGEHFSKIGEVSSAPTLNNNIYNNKYTDLSVSHGAQARGDGTDGLTDEMQFYIDCMREKMSLADEEAQGYEVKFFNICNELCHNGTAKINGREIGAAEILKEYLCLFIDDKLAKAFTKIARAADVKNKFNYTVSTLYNAARET